MKIIYLMALIPGALIVGVKGGWNLWNLLFQGQFGAIVNTLIEVAIVSVVIGTYGLIVEATGPYFINQKKR